MPGEAETRQNGRTDRWGSISDIPVDRGIGSENPSSLAEALAHINGLNGDRPGDGSRKPKREGEEHQYYDISMLQQPPWTPEVGQYFFLGGLSAGAYIMARLAERLGGGKFQSLTRVGTAVAAAAALPCAPLLIYDLGDPKRFHHMLRVWKPSSPMNFGSWVLTVYTLVGGLVALREIAHFRRGGAKPKGAAKAADIAVGVLGDAAGIPLALSLAGYTGILLSTTATPVWTKNPWIGTLFSASAISAGAGAVQLALEAGSVASEKIAASNEAGIELLGKVETAARAAEAVSYIGYLAAAGKLAAPLTQGKLKTQFWAGAIGGGLVVPEILNRLPLPRKLKPWMKLAAGIISLAGGYALRMAFVEAGKPSAADPEAARLSSKAKNGAQPWG